MRDFGFGLAAQLLRYLRIMIAGACLAGLLAGVGYCDDRVGRRIDDFQLQDSTGKEIALSDFPDRRVVVVLFMGTDCPLVKIYMPKLMAFAEEFAERGVAFLAIDSNLQDSRSELADFAQTYSCNFPILKDPENHIADQFGAQRTPEVFVLDDHRKIRYCGRIDDQYGVGYKRPEPKRYDLQIAVEELLAGEPVSQTHGEAVGCLIGRVTKPDNQSGVTWSKEISRIFQRRCQQCHREGEIAPFPLMTYDDVEGWAPMIREVIQIGRMPPWFADPAYGEFANDPKLSDDERQLIYEWVERGAPEGDPADLPPPREYESRDEGWQIEPDLVLGMNDQPFEIPADGVLDYQIFSVDLDLPEGKWVRAVQCKPGNRAVVHHFAAFLEHAALPPGSEPEMLSGYGPGTRAVPLPEGFAKYLPPRGTVIFVMHYTPIGTPQLDLSELGFEFADPDEVEHPVTYLPNISKEIAIPPHEANYVKEHTITVPHDGLLLSLVPHMHYRGKSFRFEAYYPDNTKEVLLHVPNYDFEWQLIYRLAEPKPLPAGTRIRVIGTFDNSADNVRNPDPEAWVWWGDQSTDEMLDGFIEIAWTDMGVIQSTLAIKPRNPVQAWATLIGFLIVVFLVLRAVVRKIGRWISQTRREPAIH